MARFQSNEISIKTYTCWLSISCTLPNNEMLPPNITKDHLKEYFQVKAKEIGAFHSVKLEYNEKYKSFQCFVNFLTEDSAKHAAKRFDRIELDNLKIKSEYRPLKESNAQNPLLKHAVRTETAAAKGKNPLLQNQSIIRPISNSKARGMQNENTKRYAVFGGNNAATQ
jgi:hypothetical protein